MQQNWYLLTGAPSVGKTTAISRIDELFTDLHQLNARMGYEGYPQIVTLQEVARALLAQGMHAATQEFQDKVVQMQRLVEMPLYHGHVIEDFVAIVDRTILDAYVYAGLYHLDVPFTWDDLKEWMRRYDHAFVFGIKDTHYRHDGVRTDPSSTSHPTREDIQEGIIGTLEQLQVPYTLVDTHIAKRYLAVTTHIRRDIDIQFMGQDTQERRKPDATAGPDSNLGTNGSGED